MSTGLLALLDDVAAIAKVAAASIDDVGMKAAAVSGKAAGVVIDDAAVTPRYVVGFASDRELPIIRKIAVGSLINKLVFILPAALALSLVAPWAITPLLMAGGGYLCLEGWHKVLDTLGAGHNAHAAEDEAGAFGKSAQEFEKEKVTSAVRTDFILSAEIMAIALATVAAEHFAIRAFLLALVGIVMTVAVYGVVAMIVRADDWGAALARGKSRLWRGFGRGLVRGMPRLLSALSFIGMIAMLWVGGGILIHGAHQLGWRGPDETMHHVAQAVAETAPFAHGAAKWALTAAVAAALGLLVGAFADACARYAVNPIVRRVSQRSTAA